MTVIRRHGRPRHRSTGAVSSTLLATWSGRLALVVAALGLVLMHHVVGAHQHAAADAVPAAASGTPGPSVEHGTGVHGHPPAAQEAVDPDVDSSGSAALLHDHTGGSGHDHAGSLLHLCLAALMGAAGFLVLVLVASWCRVERRAPGGGRPAAATVPRAPPTPTRLAELQILRL